MIDKPRIFTISDLHLPGGDDKSMALFGDHWSDHFNKIRMDWLDKVRPEDTVLIPGDISWAMRLEDALPDLRAIGDLPGSKVMIKGNHDYWWNSLSRIRASLPEGFYALQNDALLLNDVVLCGTRGWSYPGSEDENPETKRIYQRELIRLELSLKQAQKLRGNRRLVVLCHYPPFVGRNEESPVTALIDAYGADDVVYGHLHGQTCAAGFTGTKNSTRYWFASCDCVGFQLVELAANDGNGSHLSTQPTL